MPTEDKIILREHTEQISLYDEYRTVNSALNNQLLTVFDDLYLSTLKNGYTRYATRSTNDLPTYLYENYSCISLSYMAANNERL